MNSSQALVVVDVQIGLIDGLPAYRGPEVVATIAALITEARRCGVAVILIQHDGPPRHRLEPGMAGWPLHAALGLTPDDIVIHKRACDAFFDTSLDTVLRGRGISELIVAGCMTEYCIDTTCRRAVSLGYDVTLVADAHSTADAGALSAAQIIDHHNELLAGFRAGDHSITVTNAAEIGFS